MKIKFIPLVLLVCMIVGCTPKVNSTPNLENTIESTVVSSIPDTVESKDETEKEAETFSLPADLTDEEKEYIELLQGNWQAIVIVGGSEVRDEETLMMIEFDGMNYICRNTKGLDVEGTYTLELDRKPGYDMDKEYLFSIVLPSYGIYENRLFYYKGDDSKMYSPDNLSNRFENSDEFSHYEIYNKTDSRMINKEPEKIEPRIGMTKQEVLDSKWGEPKLKNITESENFISEQWCYSSSRYIYFEDGIVVTIQKQE